jgi:hypothetical protein
MLGKIGSNVSNVCMQEQDLTFSNFTWEFVVFKIEQKQNPGHGLIKLGSSKNSSHKICTRS